VVATKKGTRDARGCALCLRVYCYLGSDSTKDSRISANLIIIVFREALNKICLLLVSPCDGISCFIYAAPASLPG